MDSGDIRGNADRFTDVGQNTVAENANDVLITAPGDNLGFSTSGLYNFNG
jgi:hypothetical protein